ncbi:MAG: electron transfer flavoprotein beta subunit/FixA family protein [Pseudomonadota bacterium]
MMRIVVCVKQIRHVYARTGMDPKRNFLAPEDQITRVNPYDEAAVALALRAREARGGGEVILLTLGALIAEKELRRCLAMGADHLYRIDADGWMDPWQKSGLLAGAIKALGAHLVLCGRESLDRQNGQVGAFLAHHLGMPFLSPITDLKVTRQGAAEVLRNAGRGVRERIECPLPAVFSVDMGLHEPRVPA